MPQDEPQLEPQLEPQDEPQLEQLSQQLLPLLPNIPFSFENSPCLPQLSQQVEQVGWQLVQVGWQVVQQSLHFFFFLKQLSRRLKKPCLAQQSEPVSQQEPHELPELYEP